MALDMQKLELLLGKMVTELGAAVNGALVIVGDKLGGQALRIHAAARLITESA